MSMENTVVRGVRIVRSGLVVLSGLLLLATLGLLVWESTWLRPRESDGREAFLHGTSGTENIPLVVFQVLPDMFPDQFQPAGEQAGDWVQQFGFTPGTPGVNEGLPTGFAISHHRPRTGSPSPIPFVGFACGMCHTGVVQTSEKDPGTTIIGMGSPWVDFIAWVDALKTAVLDEERMTVDNVRSAYRRKYQRDLTLTERVMVGMWIRDLRATFQRNLPKFDAPFSGAEVRDARYMPNGPSRTQPFRNLVRNVMDRPATLGDHAYCKIPSIYEQANRQWGQYDGSIGNRLTRSVLAAIAVGANIDNLIVPDIKQSVVAGVEYTATLKGARYAEVFPEQGARLDAAQAARGHRVYMEHCFSCHGGRDPGTGVWIRGSNTGEVLPVEELGTDPERISFRYVNELPDILYQLFPDGHPLKPQREDIRPGPAGTTRGYINAPIEAVWARAPYLHNGSIPTLAELINLKPRRAVFYRGRNFYDPMDVGLVVPAAPDARNYYRFDTREKGNSNQGHNYPWPFDSPARDEAKLRDLLEYLKTVD